MKACENFLNQMHVNKWKINILQIIWLFTSKNKILIMIQLHELKNMKK